MYPCLLNGVQITGRPRAVFKVGVVAPLTGGSAGYGEAFVAGVKMAIADLGKDASNFEFIFEDDESTAAKSTTAAQKLINVDKVQAIISATSGTGNGVKPVATAAKIPHVCICSDIRLADNITNFTYLPLPDVEAKAWVDEAVSRQIKTFVVISQNQPGMNLIIDNLKNFAKNAGLNLLLEERYDPSIKDFKTVIAKAKSLKPDVYLVGGFPPSLDILARQMKDFSISNISGLAGTFAISKQPEGLESFWFTDGKLTDLNFKTRFETEYPAIKFNVRMTPYGYDIVNIFNSARKANQDLGSFLTNLKSYNGKVGFVTKEASSGSFKAPVGIWEIKNGKPSIIK